MDLLLEGTASWAFALGIVAVAAVCDTRTRLIPNGLTYPAFGLGLVLGLWPGDPLGLGARVLGAGCAFVPCYALFLGRALGGGDVKLFAATGALLGVPLVWPVLVHSFVAGALLTVGWMLARGRALQTLREFGAMLVSIRVGGPAAASVVTPAPGVVLPFAPALLVGLVWTGLAPALGIGLVATGVLG